MALLSRWSWSVRAAIAFACASASAARDASCASRCEEREESSVSRASSRCVRRVTRCDSSCGEGRGSCYDRAGAGRGQRQLRVGAWLFDRVPAHVGIPRRLHLLKLAGEQPRRRVALASPLRHRHLPWEVEEGQWKRVRGQQCGGPEGHRPPPQGHTHLPLPGQPQRRLEPLQALRRRLRLEVPVARLAAGEPPSQVGLDTRILAHDLLDLCDTLRLRRPQQRERVGHEGAEVGVEHSRRLGEGGGKGGVSG